MSVPGFFVQSMVLIDRLRTILSYDRILVLEAGNVAVCSIFV